MVDISAELLAIMRAIYGRDVRGSIHDALDKMCDELNEAIEHQIIELDTSLSISGAGADAAAVGNAINNIFNKSLAIRGNLAAGTDLNSLQNDIPGVYRLLKNRAYTNIPVGINGDTGWLINFDYGNSGFTTLQILIYSNSDNVNITGIYVRSYYLTRLTWSEWKKIITFGDNIDTDKTLSIENKPADAKCTGDEINNLHDAINELIDGGLEIKDEIIEEKISSWMEDHPEATTTVTDNSIGRNKLTSEIRKEFNSNKFYKNLPYKEVITFKHSTFEGRVMQGGCYTENYYVVAFRNSDTDVILRIYDKDTLSFIGLSSQLTLGHANTLCYAEGYIYVAKAFETSTGELKSNVLYKISENDLLSEDPEVETINLSFTTNGCGFDGQHFIFYCVDRDFSFIRLTDKQFNTVKDVNLPFGYNSIISIDYYNEYYFISRRYFDKTLDTFAIDSIEIYDNEFNIIDVYVLSRDWPDEIESVSIRKTDGLVMIAFQGRASYHIVESRIFIGHDLYSSQAKSTTIINDNLLLNSYFKQPFNSLENIRKVSGDSSSWIVDKWMFYINENCDQNSFIELTNDGLHILASGGSIGIIQTIPEKYISPGLNYTMSIDAEVIDDSGSCLIRWGNSRWDGDNTIGTVSSGITSVSFDFYKTPINNVRSISFVVTNGCEIIIKSAKLERGRASTLEYDMFTNRLRDASILSSYVDYRIAVTNYSMLGIGYIENGNIVIFIDISSRQRLSLVDYKIGNGSVRISLLDGTIIYSGNIESATGSANNVGTNIALFKLAPSESSNLSNYNGMMVTISANNNTDASLIFAFDEYS